MRARGNLSLQVLQSSSRLGAAAAAALAACGDDPATAETEPDFNNNNSHSGTSVLAPRADPDTAATARLLHSLLGHMPSLPGSLAPDPPDAASSFQLVQRTSGMTSCRGRMTSTGGGGGGDTHGGSGGYCILAVRPELMVCPGLARSRSERAGFQAAALMYGDGGAAAAVVAGRGLTRKSVDAAAGAEMLATRLVSDLSTAPPPEEAEGCAEEEALRAALDAAAAAAAAASSRPAAAAAAAAVMAAAPGAPTLMPAAGACCGTATSAGACRGLASYRRSAGGGEISNNSDPLSPFAQFQFQPPLRRGWSHLQRERSRSQPGSTAAGVGPMGHRARTGAGIAELSAADGTRQCLQGVEGVEKQRPRWMARFLRALHLDPWVGRGRHNGGDDAAAAGRSSIGSSSSSNRITDGGRPSSDSADISNQCKPAGGIKGNIDGLRESGSGSSGGVMADAALCAVRGKRRSGGAGGKDSKAGSGSSGKGRVPSLHGPREPKLAVAARLHVLGGRFNLRSRAPAGEPPPVMVSQDSRTIHRARLAQQARSTAAAAATAIPAVAAAAASTADALAAAAAAAAAASNQEDENAASEAAAVASAYGAQAAFAAVITTTPAAAEVRTAPAAATGALQTTPAASTSRHVTAVATVTTARLRNGVAADAATAAAPTTGISVTAFAQAATAAAAAASASGPSAAASDFAGPIDPRLLVGFQAPAIGHVGRGGVTRPRPRMRLLSAPGGRGYFEVSFTSLQELDERRGPGGAGRGHGGGGSDAGQERQGDRGGLFAPLRAANSGL